MECRPEHKALRLEGRKNAQEWNLPQAHIRRFADVTHLAPSLGRRRPLSIPNPPVLLAIWVNPRVHLLKGDEKKFDWKMEGGKD